MFQECMKDTLATIREEVKAIKDSEGRQTIEAKENVPPKDLQTRAPETQPKSTPSSEIEAQIHVAKPDPFASKFSDMGITDVRSSLTACEYEQHAAYDNWKIQRR